MGLFDEAFCFFISEKQGPTCGGTVLTNENGTTLRLLGRLG